MFILKSRFTILYTIGLIFHEKYCIILKIEYINYIDFEINIFECTTVAKLLYITAHPLDELASNSMAAGKAFIESYKENHASDEVKHIDLFKEDIPVIDKDVLTGWGKLRNGDDLTKEEQQKVDRFSEILEEFLSGDKYVFVSPMWNLSFPPVLKAYIDAISIAGKTFKYTAEGPQGLLTDKKFYTFNHVVVSTQKAQLQMLKVATVT